MGVSLQIKDSKCHKCHKVGHLAKVCGSKGTDKQGGETKWIGSYVNTEKHDELATTVHNQQQVEQTLLSKSSSERQSHNLQSGYWCNSDYNVIK